jgi:rfaE bifunctional protein kinase chain/domain
MIELQRLETLLRSFSEVSVGLVGDLFLDRYLEILPDVHEISLETGLEAFQVGQVRNQAGALGTVINNLIALGAGSLVPVSVIGKDGHGYDLMQQLQSSPVDCSHILQSTDRLTPTYTKPLRPDSQGARHELNRLDVRHREPLPVAIRNQLIEHLDVVFDQVDGLIVLDQIDQEDEGVVHREVRNHLAALARKQPNKLVFIDSRRGLSRFTFGTLKGNAAEIQAAVPNELTVEAAACALAARTGRHVFCTLGEEGTLIGFPGGRFDRAPGCRVSGPVDIVGAGDSATSGIVLATLAGAAPVEAAIIGNLVASITVQQLGTTGTAAPAQVIRRWQETRKEMLG